MPIKPDAWLSALMARDVYRIDVGDEGAEIADVVRAHSSLRARAHYFSKIDADRVDLVLALASTGAFVVDVNVTFTLSRPSLVPPASIEGVEVGPFAPADHDAVLDVAGSCFRYTRFHLDPLVEQSTAHLVKREWVANYARGARGDRLFVAKLEGRPVGFLAALAGSSHGKRVATIDLVGVAGSAQRRGVGSALVEAFAAHYRPTFDVLQVGTQVANVPSVRMYERSGYSLASSQYVMHLHVVDGKAITAPCV